MLDLALEVIYSESEFFFLSEGLLNLPILSSLVLSKECLLFTLAVDGLNLASLLELVLIVADEPLLSYFTLLLVFPLLLK